MLNGGPLASLFQEHDFQHNATYIGAVSGGSDSTALLLLLKAHFDRSVIGARLIAATVDHGLRSASRAEAESVSNLCRTLGIRHVTLHWNGEKPSRGIQAAARQARHELLANLAVREGAAAVITGHTRDDQAETVLMRSARGEGPGSAGIAPATLFRRRVWFIRPLLQTRRSELRDWLTKREVGWSEDPSNSDFRFERARARAALNASPDGGGQTEVAIAKATDAAALRIARAHWAASVLRSHAHRVSQGLIRLRREALFGSDDTLVAALRVLVAVTGGMKQLPEEAKALKLLEGLRAGNLRASLSRTLIDARRDGVFFYRESRGVPETTPKHGTVWDGRYAIVEADNAGRVDSSRIDDAPPSILRAVARSEPRLPENAGIVPLLAPWSEFLPLFDLVLANEVARLVGAPEFPPLPSRGQIATAT